MDNEKVTKKEIAKETEKEEMIKLTKTYNWEGQTISEIDMSGLEELTADDMIRANKVKNAGGNVAIVTETDLEYTLIIASFATDLPVEFFKSLRPRDAIKVKNKVTGFFFSEE